MKEHKNHIDIFVFVSVIALLVFSLAAVYSASSTFSFAKQNDFSYFFRSHTIKVLIAFVALILGMNINYQWYKKLTKKVIIVSVILLIFTFIFGTVIKGANRWLSFGTLSFQPSEIGKFALIFHLAFLLEQKADILDNFGKGVSPLLIWTGVIAGLVMMQPSFSAGAMICLISLTIFFVGNVRIKHLLLVMASIIPILALYAISAQYRLNRILSYFGQSDSADMINYQVTQAIIGFGNGAIFGVGPGQSRQRDFFLPESYGDFIFAIIGEEYGFIGATIILAIFVLIMIRGIKIAKRAPDLFGRNLAVGLTSAITLYALVNTGVASGVFPTTGLPLPFLSYGGTSMLLSAFAIGVILNISKHTDIIIREQDFNEIENNEPIVGQVYK